MDTFSHRKSTCANPRPWDSFHILWNRICDYPAFSSELLTVEVALHDELGWNLFSPSQRWLD
jgi:hypothetical protein